MFHLMIVVDSKEAPEVEQMRAMIVHSTPTHMLDSGEIKVGIGEATESNNITGEEREICLLTISTPNGAFIPAAYLYHRLREISPDPDHCQMLQSDEEVVKEGEGEGTDLRGAGKIPETSIRIAVAAAKIAFEIYKLDGDGNDEDDGLENAKREISDLLDMNPLHG